MTAYVYLITEEAHPTELIGSWTKIGYSKNPPEWRLNANLKRGNSRNLHVKAAFVYTSEQEARAAEKLAHAAFAEHKGQKEWFNIEWQRASDWFTSLGAIHRPTEITSLDT